MCHLLCAAIDLCDQCRTKKGSFMTAQDLSPQINKIGFYGVIAILVTTILSLIFPLAAPAPNQNDAIQWLMNDMGSYVFGWINQIFAMLAFSVVFAVAAWQVFEDSPIAAIISWAFTLMATMAFFIVKFINVWAVPMMAKALASGAAESATAETFLTTHAPSIAFGLGPSLDYLGFVLYAVAGLLIWRSLYKKSTSAKVAGIGLLLFGILYFLVIFAPYFSLLGQADIEGAVLIPVLPLLVSFGAFFVLFKEQRGLSSASLAG